MPDFANRCLNNSLKGKLWQSTEVHWRSSCQAVTGCGLATVRPSAQKPSFQQVVMRREAISRVKASRAGSAPHAGPSQQLMNNLRQTYITSSDVLASHIKAIMYDGSVKVKHASINSLFQLWSLIFKASLRGNYNALSRACPTHKTTDRLNIKREFRNPEAS